MKRLHLALILPCILPSSIAVAEQPLIKPQTHGEVTNGRLLTINDGGSRNGIGVFKRDAQKISQINKGFIDYSAVEWVEGIAKPITINCRCDGFHVAPPIQRATFR